MAALADPSAARDRWRLAESGIEWIIDNGDSPHSDHIEMSGRRVAVIVTYGTNQGGELVLSRRVVWPMLRTIPNDTHASLIHDFGIDASPQVTVDGQPIGVEKPFRVAFDGTLTLESHTAGGIDLARTLLPSREGPYVIERWMLRNANTTAVTVAASPLQTEYRATGVAGEYVMEARSAGLRPRELAPGATVGLDTVYTGRVAPEAPPQVDGESEERDRRAFVHGLSRSLRLETPDPVLDRAFELAKLRAAESIFATKGGLMHGPGGGRYYAAIWANDQAEYAAPFFPFLGDAGGNEASLNCFRHFARFMTPEYTAIPSSVIAEGVDTWGGAGDRGDAAMVAYGASRYALALGDRAVAQELWPAIRWCLEYCRRHTTAERVIASDSDELEGRFPAGRANLNTSTLTYGALRSAADVARALGDGASADEYDRWAVELRADIDRYFGATVEGFDTYRYYDGNTVLRAWICVPLTMGIDERKAGTLQALFSPRLWTVDGLATQAGEITFWDRSTLYALRGVFFVGETDRALRYFAEYSRRRLLGDHVPYAVEAYPEGNQAHLSAESALYCRVVTEGLFGIVPTGLSSFRCAPKLPSRWDHMALRNVRAFGREFSIVVTRQREGTEVSVLSNGHTILRRPWTGEGSIEVALE